MDLNKGKCVDKDWRWVEARVIKTLEGNENYRLNDLLFMPADFLEIEEIGEYLECGEEAVRAAVAAGGRRQYYFTEEEWASGKADAVLRADFMEVFERVGLALEDGNEGAA
ncbi:hypothetical protein [Chromobacterium sphagni]|uniref:Uncharacterized protein n=1 Tax=Chromobacterium sphagni TaxID=1903179 RepID=A0ABX3CEN2_9NEIS|nr:hypothetical protein [Chromobacterium sphagni]OHX20505.1 hypothetical protein BI344_08575 [Chromobacterium sphagni]